MDKKTLIIAQIILTCLMAFSMSGIMMLITVGPFEGFIADWIKAWLTAWPIAFIVTQFVSAIAFPLAGFIRSKLN